MADINNIQDGQIAPGQRSVSSPGVPLGYAVRPVTGQKSWAMGFLAVMVLSITSMVILGIVFPETARMGFFPIGLGLPVIVCVVGMHVVITILGTVISGRGRVFRNVLAIPFIRPTIRSAGVSDDSVRGSLVS